MNKKLPQRGMKVLKVVHLICAVAWMGSAIIMSCLRLFVGATDAAGMFYMAEVLESIDMKILVPGAVGCLVTGLLYGLFTNWGFFKHRWLTVKWVLVVFMMSLGTFYMGPLVKDNVLISRNLMNGSGNAAAYWQNVVHSTYCGWLQVSLLVLVIILSVWKPWKKRQAKR